MTSLIILFLLFHSLTANEDQLRNLERIIANGLSNDPRTTDIAQRVLQQWARTFWYTQQSKPNKKQLLIDYFGTTTPSTSGTVGANPKIIKNCIEGKRYQCNLRELLTLFYRGTIDYRHEKGTSTVMLVMNDILDQVLKRNPQLSKQLPFLDTKLIRKKNILEHNFGLKRMINSGNKRKCFLELLAPLPSSQVRKCRCESDFPGSLNHCRISTSKDEQIPKLSTDMISSMGQHERTFAGVNRKNTKLPWLGGGAYFKVPLYISSQNLKKKCPAFSSKSKYYNEITTNPALQVASQFGMPLVAGPSGTADMFYWIIRFLGFKGQDLINFKNALIGWMVQVEDHSIHEILQSASFHLNQNYLCKRPGSYSPAACIFSNQFDSQAQHYIVGAIKHEFPKFRSLRKNAEVFQKFSELYNSIAYGLKQTREYQLVDILRSC